MEIPVVGGDVMDTEGWTNSLCGDLADAASVFRLITSIPDALSLASSEAEHPSPFALFFDDRCYPHAFRLDRLHTAAHCRLQACFTDLVSSHILELALALCSTVARARIRSCSVDGSFEFFLLYTIPREVQLDDFALSLLLAHRLGIPLTYLLEACHLSRCGRYCRRVTPHRPLSRDDPTLGYTWEHAYHQLGCGCDYHRFARHEAIVKVFARSMVSEGGFHSETRRSLGSSLQCGTKVDLLLTALDRDPPVSAFDVTVSCPLLPSYVSPTAAHPTHVIAEKASEKISKHLPGCLELGRAFYPMVVTTLGGVGPRTFLSFVHKVFDEAAAAEVLLGERGARARYRRMVLFASIHAALTRSMATMLRDRLIRGAGTAPDQEGETHLPSTSQSSSAALACDGQSPSPTPSSVGSDEGGYASGECDPEAVYYDDTSADEETVVGDPAAARGAAPD